MKRGWVLLLLWGTLLVSCTGDPTIGVGNKVQGIRLYPPYPNPFSRSLVVWLKVTTDEAFELVVQNPTGETIRTLVRGPLEPGRYPVRWDAKNRSGRVVKPGFYFVTLKKGSEVASYLVKREAP